MPPPSLAMFLIQATPSPAILLLTVLGLLSPYALAERAPDGKALPSAIPISVLPDTDTGVSAASAPSAVNVHVEVNVPGQAGPGRYQDYPPAMEIGAPPPVPGSGTRPDPAYCDYMARREAQRQAQSSPRPLAGAARGAFGGAAFGALVGSRKDARRGALLGATLGLVANGARQREDQNHVYQRIYVDCLQGYRR